MVAANIMTTDILKLYRSSTLFEALNACRTQKIRQVPVVDGSNKLIGVVTTKGLFRAVLPGYIAEGLLDDVSFAPDLPDFIENIKALTSKCVLDFLDRDYVAIRPDVPVMEVCAIFVSPKKSVESIMVVDNASHLLGIISPWDVFKRLCDYM